MHNDKSQALEWRKCYKMGILSYSNSSFSDHKKMYEKVVLVL